MEACINLCDMNYGGIVCRGLLQGSLLMKNSIVMQGQILESGGIQVKRPQHPCYRNEHSHQHIATSFDYTIQQATTVPKRQNSRLAYNDVSLTHSSTASVSWHILVLSTCRQHRHRAPRSTLGRPSCPCCGATPVTYPPYGRNAQAPPTPARIPARL